MVHTPQQRMPAGGSEPSGSPMPFRLHCSTSAMFLQRWAAHEMAAAAPSPWLRTRIPRARGQSPARTVSCQDAATSAQRARSATSARFSSTSACGRCRRASRYALECRQRTEKLWRRRRCIAGKAGRCCAVSTHMVDASTMQACIDGCRDGKNVTIR